MDSNTLRELLSNCERSGDKLVSVMNNDILPTAVTKLNEKSRRRMGKLKSEKLPRNERNLTDARTRIGILLEYSLADIIDSQWQEMLRGEHTLAYVVINRFPDLISRNGHHETGIRVEVKAIEAVSEEKSANLDVLVMEVRESGDVLCVLLWEWNEYEEGGIVAEYPHVYHAYAFPVRTIAQVRDVAWLHDMSRAKFKAIDVAGPVVGSGDGLKEEEHNMGKLLRIAASGDFDDGSLAYLKSHPAVLAYQAFKAETITIGIQTIVRRAFVQFGVNAQEEQINNFRFSARSLTLVAAGKTISTALAVYCGTVRRKEDRVSILDELKAKGITTGFVLTFGEKFTWCLYKIQGEELVNVTPKSDKKPTKALKELEKHLQTKHEPTDTVA